MRWSFLVAAVAFASASAQQITYLPFKNLSDTAHPFGYYVDDRNPMPAGLTSAAVKTAADRAWSKWNAVSCASPKSTPLGLTSGNVPTPTDPYDTFNVTPVFVTSTSEPFYGNIFGPGVRAITLPLQYAGVLQHCDIYLNGAIGAPWSVAPTTPPNASDVETVMLHEAGHCLGIDHPNAPGSVMNATILPGETNRDLAPADVDVLCDRYPVAGAVGSPCPDGGGCGSNRCVTQPSGTGPPARYCTRGCAANTGAACELPLTCQASSLFTPTFNGACLRPGTDVTQIGKPCQFSDECGSQLGICEPPLRHATGTIFWLGGYCWQDCSPGRPECPAGSACTQVGNSTMCLQSCRVGFADCRPGYSCASTVNGGVCAPRCEVNGDCASGGNFACRNCDGLCIPINNQTQPGDVCQDDSQCGLSQTCIRLSAGSTVKLCSSACGAGCESCPTGSSCQPVPTAGNQFFCLRNCTGGGTCPNGLQCANLPTGRGCIPPCNTERDCPVGTTCNQGECSPPGEPDSGCGLLCTSEDGGAPITPKPKDGGAGGGGGGGCGCSSTPAVWTLGLAALAWTLTRRRARGD